MHSISSLAFAFDKKSTCFYIFRSGKYLAMIHICSNLFDMEYLLIDNELMSKVLSLFNNSYMKDTIYSYT